MSFIDELKSLDRNNIGGWSKSVKIFFTALVFGLVVFLGWYLQVSNQQDDLANLAAKEQTLKQTFSKKQAQAVNLEALQQQLNEMKDMLRQLLRQLPSETEMPELLVDISQTALAAGIDVKAFTPEPEIPKDFYAEKPISLEMTGTYHQFGTFISAVASLPRVVILTMHDVTLTPLDGKNEKPSPDQKLVLKGKVYTYRYMDEDEGAKSAKGGRPARKTAGGRK